MLSLNLFLLLHRIYLSIRFPCVFAFSVVSSAFLMFFFMRTILLAQSGMHARACVFAMYSRQEYTPAKWTASPNGPFGIGNKNNNQQLKRRGQMFSTYASAHYSWPHKRSKSNNSPNCTCIQETQINASRWIGKREHIG